MQAQIQLLQRSSPCSIPLTLATEGPLICLLVVKAFDLEEARVSRQAMRQVARRRVQEALATKQRDREAQERRLQIEAVAVLTALAERDAAVALAEQAAAASIEAMVADGLSLKEVADWCGGLAVREVTRLTKIAPKSVAS